MISSSLPCSLFRTIFQNFLIKKFDKISIAKELQIFDSDGTFVIRPPLIEKDLEFFEVDCDGNQSAAYIILRQSSNCCLNSIEVPESFYQTHYVPTYNFCICKQCNIQPSKSEFLAHSLAHVTASRWS